MIVRDPSLPTFQRQTLSRAFTLLELVVVVAIVSVLSALIYSAVQSVRQRGAATQSSSNLRALAAANIAYLGEFGRYAPADEKRNLRRWHGARKSIGAAFDATKGFLSPYLGRSQRITMCPVFQDMLKGRETFEDGTGGYGYNEVYVGGTPGGKWGSDGLRESALMGNIERPASTVMFTSTAYAREQGVQEYPFCEPPFWDYGEGPTKERPSPTVHFRFGGQALVAWCDGHVTFESPQAAKNLKEGFNPHGGDATSQGLGWFGPEENNGFWNPQYDPTAPHLAEESEEAAGAPTAAAAAAASARGGILSRQF